ncbi:hypothetical protein BK008_01860 [Methanobacterium sp. MZ-A1]|jgi:hypothetical protein|uniref:hypothetical protein n=1 Tax=Methanobacterium sp. MZ-A1 TaxID=1911685 RepID=UPI000C2D407E|nr:hypothetical protein [Methanobacterium sp. MZ-A1]AUB57191.1 hypothetical protein BK008_01860 [Methanobacterium sp. MZ-A1]MBW4258079.1 hypothetical protein [Methanobacterium sp. YSL]
MLGTVVSEGKTIVTAELLSPLLLPLMPLNVLNTLKPGFINESEQNEQFNSATYLLKLMSQYWGESGPSQWFWDRLKESLEKYYHDITPSQSDLEKETPENLMDPPKLTEDYNFVIFGYGGHEEMILGSIIKSIECLTTMIVGLWNGLLFTMLGANRIGKLNMLFCYQGELSPYCIKAIVIHLNLKYLKMNKEE